jgi:hypothetical protein
MITKPLYVSCSVKWPKCAFLIKILRNFQPDALKQKNIDSARAHGYIFRCRAFDQTQSNDCPVQDARQAHEPAFADAVGDESAMRVPA